LLLHIIFIIAYFVIFKIHFYFPFFEKFFKKSVAIYSIKFSIINIFDIDPWYLIILCCLIFEFKRLNWLISLQILFLIFSFISYTIELLLYLLVLQNFLKIMYGLIVALYPLNSVFIVHKFMSCLHPRRYQICVGSWNHLIF
jgi:hypothetical protein